MVRSIIANIQWRRDGHEPPMHWRTRTRLRPAVAASPVKLPLLAQRHCRSVVFSNGLRALLIYDPDCDGCDKTTLKLDMRRFEDPRRPYLGVLLEQFWNGQDCVQSDGLMVIVDSESIRQTISKLAEISGFCDVNLKAEPPEGGGGGADVPAAAPAAADEEPLVDTPERRTQIVLEHANPSYPPLSKKARVECLRAAAKKRRAALLREFTEHCKERFGPDAMAVVVVSRLPMAKLLRKISAFAAFAKNERDDASENHNDEEKEGKNGKENEATERPEEEAFRVGRETPVVIEMHCATDTAADNEARRKLWVVWPLLKCSVSAIEIIMELLHQNSDSALMSLLRSKGMASELNVKFEEGLLVLDMTLTSDFISQYEKVIRLVCDYVDHLRTTGVPEWFIKQVNDVRCFHAQLNNLSAVSGASILSSNCVFDVPPSDWILPPRTQAVSMTDNLQKILNLMSSDRFVAVVPSQQAEEPKLVKRLVTADEMSKWRPAAGTDALSGDTFRQVKANRFCVDIVRPLMLRSVKQYSLPLELQLPTTPSPITDLVPRLFFLPRSHNLACSVVVQFSSPLLQFPRTPLDRVLAQLAVAIVERAVQGVLDEARNLGVTAEVTFPRGAHVAWRGFQLVITSKYYPLLPRVIKEIFTEVYAVAKNAIEDERLFSDELRKLKVQLVKKMDYDYLLLHTLASSCLHPSLLSSETPDWKEITVERTKAVMELLCQGLSAEVFVVGNATEDEARNYAQLIAESVGKAPQQGGEAAAKTRPPQQLKPTSAPLPRRGNWRIRKDTHFHTMHCVGLFYLTTRKPHEVAAMAQIGHFAIPSSADYDIKVCCHHFEGWSAVGVAAASWGLDPPDLLRRVRRLWQEHVEEFHQALKNVRELKPCKTIEEAMDRYLPALDSLGMLNKQREFACQLTREDYQAWVDSLESLPKVACLLTPRETVPFLLPDEPDDLGDNDVDNRGAVEGETVEGGGNGAVVTGGTVVDHFMLGDDNDVTWVTGGYLFADPGAAAGSPPPSVRPAAETDQ